MPENETLNDGLVSIFHRVVSAMHFIAILALIPVNWVLYQAMSAPRGIVEILFVHVVANFLLCLSYLLFMGTIGILISIDGNLKRLVDLQRGTSETPRQQVSPLSSNIIHADKVDSDDSHPPMGT